ncbi:PPE domain-containing protein [Mycolicibacterium sp. P9-22]|uniref:Tox-REase-5 domain-containing protein n=1 Tax=Mycolicibacterium sp. P9-22 TaxID=2024613 RepID=UPI001D149467|nr:Tox-REase-5 domain-containing protein [Mycolicibacterium sp. P9-22]
MVDTDGLAADGRRLASTDNDLKHKDCRQPAHDPVSISAARSLSDHNEGFVQRLDEAAAVRDHGGEIVKASAVMFQVADEQGALEIDRVEVLGAPRPPSAGPPTITQPPQPKTVPVPRAAKIQSQSMEADDFSEAIHSGAGARGVRDFARDWSDATRTLEFEGDSVRRIGDSIQENWADSDSNAAPNVRLHGTWLKDASEWAGKLSQAAGGCADAFDTAKRDTPTPVELAGAKQAVAMGVLLGPAGALVAKMRLDSLRAKAIAAGAVYEQSAKTAVATISEAMPAPPLIAKWAAIPGELVKGPGTWTSKSRREGEWRDYEHQVTGYPAGMEYEVPRINGEPVPFDGFEPDTGPNGLLVEAKGKGYEWMVGDNGEFKPDIKGVQQLQNEMLAQYEASKFSGVPVEWRVADARVADAMEALIEDGGYGDCISITVVPAA